MKQQSQTSLFVLFLTVFSANVCAAGNSAEVHDDARATFRVAAPKADKVLLLGDWLKRGDELAVTKGDDGVWSATAGPSPPGNHLYAFVIDGAQVPDPENSSVKLRASRAGLFFHVPGNAVWRRHFATLAPKLFQATAPPPGTTGNADNVPFIGGRDPKGNPVRLAMKTGHVSNYDESKVPEYSLPDPLKMSDGRPVKTAEEWKARRTEILRFYEEQIYGRVPANAPTVTWKVVETDNNSRGGMAITRKIEGAVGAPEATDRAAPKLRVTLHLPKESKGRVPVMLNLSFFSADFARPRRSGSDEVQFDPITEVLSHGWAFAQIGYNDIQPDRADQWQQGVIGLTLMEGQTRPALDEWGTISAWAWGASRVIDYLETDDAIDKHRIAITGASRLGKTVLWAAAKDVRISSVFSVVPGAMGAALIRRDWGETLDDMAQNFSWQFADNLQRWVGKWNELPIDQHMLISLIAPRPVYVNGGISDQWSDPKGEFLSMVAAGPVYRLLGATDLGTDQLPKLDHPITLGRLAFHYHSQGHRAVPEDWKQFLRFADRHYSSR